MRQIYTDVSINTQRKCLRINITKHMNINTFWCLRIQGFMEGSEHIKRSVISDSSDLIRHLLSLHMVSFIFKHILVLLWNIYPLSQTLPFFKMLRLFNYHCSRFSNFLLEPLFQVFVLTVLYNFLTKVISDLQILNEMTFLSIYDWCIDHFYFQAFGHNFFSWPIA